jgi:hypothetical protein
MSHCSGASYLPARLGLVVAKAKARDLRRLFEMNFNHELPFCAEVARHLNLKTDVRQHLKARLKIGLTEEVRKPAL